jgi:acyl-CoA synthetase (AMP-forming)/AMP-acid ligase II
LESLMRPPIVNIAAHLPAQARAHPHTLAVVQPRGRRSDGRLTYRHYTFRELNDESDRLARGLERSRVGRGVRTVLMVPPSLDFYTLTFALFKVGAVVVLIDPGMGMRNLGVCLKEAEPHAFIGVTKAHLARLLYGWGGGSVRRVVTVGPRLFWGGVTLPQLRRLGAEGPPPLTAPTPNETAAILFTSGSTGVAKGVVYTHEIFNAQVDLLQRTYHIEPGELDLATFPLFGLFGPALGMGAVVPPMDPTRPAHVDPQTILDAVRQFGVTNLFGSPALIRRVGRFGAERGVQLPSLRRVLSAGAPVSARALEAFAAMLPEGVEVHTPYGATEALPAATIGSKEILKDTSRATAEGAGACVGRPVEGVQVRIMKIRDDAVSTWSDELAAAPGEIGEIVVQGPIVTRSYFNRDAATRQAKIDDPASGGFYHRMGDLGYLDSYGRLWFCGRKSQRVETSAETLFTIPCEGVFNAHPAVARTALVGVERGGGVEPVLCVEVERPARIDGESLRRELLALGALRSVTKNIKTILFHPSFPVDVRHNAKIHREKLAAWAARRLGGTAAETHP